MGGGDRKTPADLGLETQGRARAMAGSTHSSLIRQLLSQKLTKATKPLLASLPSVKCCAATSSDHSLGASRCWNRSTSLSPPHGCMQLPARKGLRALPFGWCILKLSVGARLCRLRPAAARCPGRVLRLVFDTAALRAAGQVHRRLRDARPFWCGQSVWWFPSLLRFQPGLSPATRSSLYPTKRFGSSSRSARRSLRRMDVGWLCP